MALGYQHTVDMLLDHGVNTAPTQRKHTLEHTRQEAAVTDIFSYPHLMERFWAILEERDPRCCVYVYRIDNGTPLRPALLKGEPRASLLEELRDSFGAGEFQVMVRRGTQMLLAGRIAIAPLVTR